MKWKKAGKLCGHAAFLALITMFFTVMHYGQAEAAELTQKEQLGKQLFFDPGLSTPHGQSCASCHLPEAGYTGPDSSINAEGAVYSGVVHTRFGNRKPPTAAYGGKSPVLHFDEDEQVWIGGMFWDGRSSGWILGDPLAEQAGGPFLNPLEQKSPNMKLVCLKVSKSDYAGLFEEVWGEGSLDCVKDEQGAYEKIQHSIAAYERSAEVNPYSSKYDAESRGDVEFTELEAWGDDLFNGKALCSECHSGLDFTDFTYDNVGVPKNPKNPFYTMPKKWNPDGKDWVDPGLGGFLKEAGYDPEVYQAEWGKQKVPTLRNVDRRPYPGFVKAYGHNGKFKSLEEIVHFYNTRDVPGAGWNGKPWPAPEVAENVNIDELGNLGLTPDEEKAIVAYLKTLTDGFDKGAE